MNYLAHIYLAGKNQKLQTGGFIADFVKGSNSARLPEKIWEGIVLHRKIDSYTDSHPIVKNLIIKLRPEFGRYSAIVLDMYFDHLLAKKFKLITNKNLWWFSIRFSITVLYHYRYLPQRVKGFIFHFTGTNRLYKYSTIQGLEESLTIMSVHKIKALEPRKCISFLENNINNIEEEFNHFFKDLIQYVSSQLV